MQINPLTQPTNQKLNNDKSTAATEKQEKGSSVEAFKDNAERFSSANSRLKIGAQALMASLNQELKLEGSFSFQSSFSESFSTKIESGSILDKIEVEPLDFDFEEVAKNVLEFVGKTIQGAKSAGASDEELEAMLAQAREGIDSGFAQARQELGDLDMLSGDVEEGVDRSYDLITKGVNELEESLFSNAVNEADLITSNVVARDLGVQETEQGSVSIQTLDGDEINISFGRSTSLAQSQSFGANGSSSQTQFSQSQSFSLEITGDLDDEEREAINSLVNDIGELANEFFNGDVQKAFEQASSLGFDSSQIAQFSLDFQEVKQVAVRERYSENKEASPIATIAPYLDNLNEIMESGESLFSQDNLNQLMEGVAQEQLAMVDELLAKSAADFSNFNQQLINAQEKES